MAARLVIVTALVGAVMVVTVPGVATGQTDLEQELAERYAPQVMLKAQEAECDANGEPYTPMSVEGLLGNPEILLRQVGTGNPVMTNAPSASDIHGLGEGFFLDFPGNALSPGCIFERDSRSYNADLPAVVYAHVATQDDAPGRLALQYWLFWYYNDWNNKHEGDWEGIQLLFEVGTVEEALEAEPVSVGYAQHEGGERADWDDPKLERQGTRPVVYPSAGSHASYYGSAVYLGRSGSEGFGCDTTDGPSVALETEVVVLPDEVADPQDRLAWLAFDGRWGERQAGPFNGPTGPSHKSRWSKPVDWHEELRDSSVVVPAGDGAPEQLIQNFCGVVEWGSAQLITLTQNPVGFVIGVGVVFAATSFALGRTDWSPVRPLPVRRRRRAGQIIGAALALFRSHPIGFVVVGLVYIPLSLLVALAVRLLQLIPLVGSLAESDTDLGAVGVFLTVIVGGFAHIAGLTVVIAAVALFLRGLEDGEAVSGGQALQQVIARTGDLARGFVRATIIVGALLLSIVGIPWAIRQLIRYQFFAPITVLEDRGGRDALDRSTALVSGRWFHTAAVIALVNLFVGLLSTVIGLLLLILASGLPLWLFSALVTIGTAFFVPLSAIAIVLLYGDARAEHEGSERAEPIVAEPPGSHRTTPATTDA